MGAKKPPEGYISVPEAAKMVGVVPMTFYNWMFTRAVVPFKTRQAGSRCFYYIKKSDVEKYLEAQKIKDRRLRKKHFYEIVAISMGQVTVLYQTENLMELSHMYIHMMEKQHKLIRVRMDGNLLTIHESDKLGNSYHPRTKARAI